MSTEKIEKAIQSVVISRVIECDPPRCKISIFYNDGTEEKTHENVTYVVEQYYNFLSEASKQYIDKSTLKKPLDSNKPDDQDNLKTNQPLNECNKNDDVHHPVHQDEEVLLPKDNNSFCNLSMQILGGFMTVLGVAAIAVAFTALNAATLGIPGLVVAVIGAATLLSGVGLFAFGSVKQCAAPSSIEFSPT